MLLADLGWPAVLNVVTGGQRVEPARFGYPHVEAYWFAEGVMPRLRARGLLGGNGATPPAVVAASA